MFGVVVVGAGHSGGRVAERLRAFGYDKRIALVGQEPHRPYERPPLSKGILTAEASRVPPELFSPKQWEALKIEFFANTICRSVDRRKRTVTLSTGAVLSYEHLILATGLTPRRLPLIPTSKHGIFSVNKFDDSASLRDRLPSAKTVLVVGGGFIGLEVAASARKLGACVTVVELANRPLQRVLRSELSDWMADWHRTHGVEILCGRQITGCKSIAGHHRVSIDDGRELDAELIVIGVGGTPHVDVAANAGLAVDDGVVVDAGFRSSDPSIFAIGDIARMTDDDGRGSQRLESWKNAEASAAVAARNICGERAAYEEVPWFWTDQFGHNLQMTGRMPSDADVYERGLLGQSGYLAYYGRGENLLGAFGIDCGGDIRRARAHIEKRRPIATVMLNKAGLRPRDSESAAAARGAAR